MKDLLYRQIYTEIKTEIETGKIKPGEQILPEVELMEKYKVSRITVRKALKMLADENYIVRSAGKGTFVPLKHYQRSISSTMSFSQVCACMGYESGAHTVKCCIEDATEEDIKELGVNPGAKVVVVERLRYADGVPVSFEISRFTEKYDFLLHENLNDESMYAIIQEKYGITFSNSQKVLELQFSNYEWSKYLSIPTNYPLLSIKSIVSTTSGEKAQRSHQLIVGTKFKLII